MLLLQQKKKKNHSQPSIIKKKNIILFLSLLVNYCILMYLEIMILNIYNFLILYRGLFRGFFFFSALAQNHGSFPAQNCNFQLNNAEISTSYSSATFCSDSILRSASNEFKKMGQRIFVFIIGGATRSEVSFLKFSLFLELQLNFGYNLIFFPYTAASYEFVTSSQQNSEGKQSWVLLVLMIRFYISR